MRRLLLTGAVLGGLFVGGNKVAENVAESAIQDRLVKQLGFSGQVGVEIDSFPFLVDAIGGHVDAISVTVREQRIGDLVFREITLRLVDINAEGSLLGSGPLELRVATTAGSARGDQEALNAFLKRRGEDARVTLGSGSVTVTSTRSIAGVRRKVVARGRLSVGDGRLGFRADDVRWEGPAPPGSREAAKRAASFSEALPKLPAGLKITRIEVRPDGFTFLAKGSSQRFKVRE